MEILPGIHELRESLAPVYPDPRCWVSVYLLVGTTCALVDSGVPRTADTLVLPYLAQLGIAPERLEMVVNTHGHGDHIGSNVRLREQCGAQILVHAADVSWLAQGGMYGEDPIPAHRPDRTLRAGDRVQLGTATYEVLSLAGHSPGSLGLWDAEAGTLFCGDSLQGQGTTVQGTAFYVDPDAYLASVEQVLALSVQHLCAAHPYGPATLSHVHGSDVRPFLEQSRHFARHYDEEIVDTLRAASRPQTATEIATVACTRRGFPGVSRMALMVTTAHLERLATRGVVHSEGTDPDATWQLA